MNDLSYSVVGGRSIALCHVIWHMKPPIRRRQGHLLLTELGNRPKASASRICTQVDYIFIKILVIVTLLFSNSHVIIEFETLLLATPI
jgi:hypothetical protein